MSWGPPSWHKKRKKKSICSFHRKCVHASPHLYIFLTYLGRGIDANVSRWILHRLFNFHWAFRHFKSQTKPTAPLERTTFRRYSYLPDTFLLLLTCPSPAWSFCCFPGEAEDLFSQTLPCVIALTGSPLSFMSIVYVYTSGTFGWFSALTLASPQHIPSSSTRQLGGSPGQNILASRISPSDTQNLFFHLVVEELDY